MTQLLTPEFQVHAFQEGVRSDTFNPEGFPRDNRSHLSVVPEPQPSEPFDHNPLAVKEKTALYDSSDSINTASGLPGLDRLELYKEYTGNGLLVDGRFEIVENLRSAKTRDNLTDETVGWGTYKAIDTETGNEVALKIAREDGVHGYFAKIETSIHASLAELEEPHPNVIKCLDQGSGFTPDGQMFTFTTTELTNLGTLQNIKDIDPEELADIISQIAEGIAWLNSIGLVHDDLKPSNVGLHRNEDGSIVVKILDFGSARPIEDDPDRFSLNHDQQFDTAVNKLNELEEFSSTKNFASPEMIEGFSQDNLKPSNDSYSIGKIALFLYKYRASSSPTEAAGTKTNPIESGNIDIDSMDLSELDPTLEIVIRACLEEKKDKRLEPFRIPKLLALI